MADRFVSRGFVGRRQMPGGDEASRTPPGQYLTRDFPVLSAGPTPRVPLDTWSFTVDGLVRSPMTWSWQFQELPARDWSVDISCVTKWTKLDTRWTGVSVDTLLEQVELGAAVMDPSPAALLYSSRTIGDVIYRSELDALARAASGPLVRHTLTREQPPGWDGYARRVDERMLRDMLDLVGDAGDGPLAYICGPTLLVEGAAGGLTNLGLAAARIRTERFGPTT